MELMHGVLNRLNRFFARRKMKGKRSEETLFIGNCL